MGMKINNSFKISVICCSLFIICAGCKTGGRADSWEYKDFFATSTTSLNDEAKSGWFVVDAYYDTENKSTHYLLRRLK